jgi:hypothetical protein
LSVAVIAAVAIAGLIGAGPGAAKPTKAAKTGLTIRTWSQGLLGYVNSPDAERCAVNRRVVVFQQRGATRKPASDRRVAGDRSGDASASYQWSVETGRSGRFYARAVKKAGCAEAISGTIHASAVAQAPGGAQRTSYPICGPYVSEGASEVCRFDQLHLHAEGTVSSPCRFGNETGSCGGQPTAGLFPWGDTGNGERPSVSFVWSPSGGRRSIRITVFRDGQGTLPAALLYGSVPSSGSPRLTIDEGYAQSEKGHPNGDRFYTPDLPGQAAGEPGGPLAINVQNGGSLSPSAEVDISGYLYLKR